MSCWNLSTLLEEGNKLSYLILSIDCRGLQGDVVYLGWPIVPFVIYEPKFEGGGGRGGCGVSSNENSCAHHVTWSPNKLWRSNSIWLRWLMGLVTDIVCRHALAAGDGCPPVSLLCLCLLSVGRQEKFHKFKKRASGGSNFYSWYFNFYYFL